MSWHAPIPRYPILIVDDDPLSLGATEVLLQKHGYPVDCASSNETALAALRNRRDHYAIAIVDYQLNGMHGSETAKALLSLAPEIYVLMYSGDPSRAAVQSSWQAGAIGFIEKGASNQVLIQTIEGWNRKYHETRATLAIPAVGETHEITELHMVGKSAALREAASKVKRYQKNRQNVLITGETGTGKELVARALSTPGTPFFPVSCATYRGNTELLESELFGYEKGAFTGADREKMGVFEAAQGGTVFLDEIHHLSVTAQAKLLRAFQEKKIRRVGGLKEYSVNFRLITAAKPDLEALAERGEFLPDLFHRLNVLSIHLPPLRERPEDIEPLVLHFCRKFEETTGQPRTIRRQTLQYFENYPWPGNVRELENTIVRLLTDCTSAKVGPEHLDAKFFSNSANIDSSYDDMKRRLEAQERDYIRRVVESSPSKFQAAKRLHISPTTLHSVMQRLGLYRTKSSDAEDRST